MPGKSAVLTIKILGDQSQGAKALGQASDGVQKFTDRVNKASVVAGAALAGLAVSAKQLGDSASRLQQSGGAIESVFGGYAANVEKLASKAATGVGLAKSQYEELASVLGAQLRNAGLSGNALVGTVDDLIKRGADMAATFGGTTADAVEALSSTLKGEFDPIERYGVTIKQSAINAVLAAQGQDKLTGAALQAATAQAALGLITQQTSAYTGQFARESGSAAGAMQIGTAAAENAKAQLGNALLPAYVLFGQVLESVAGFTEKHTTGVQILAGTLAVLALGVLAVNGAMRLYQAVSLVATAAQWAFNAAVGANPLTIIIIAVLALIGMVVLLVNHFGGLKNVLSAVGDFFGSVGRAIVKLWQPVVDLVKWLWDKFMALVNFGAKIGSWVGGLFSAPAAGGGGGAGGGFAAGRGWGGAAGGGYPAGPMLFGAAGTGTPAGGIGPSAGRGSTVVVNNNVTVQGAVDPDGTAATIDKLLDRRSKNLGRTPTLKFGNR